ncbi:hypothetical protein DY000_02038894 [Brassica cretica]|uniref:No apical meristem-associated C-terminal domain-containing protein n=1 Tax=Brassica cretica TaxID=69181 RepID=A0ABQ7BQ73_BRACR|nr:hypothetical protein DY000_02038894 [Brassica cretica]
MDFIAMIDEKVTNQFVLTFESSDLLWRKRPPEKPPWICDGEEALETQARISLTISFERISTLDFFSKNIYSSYLESGQCYTTKKSTKRKGTSSQNTTSPPKPTLEPGSESVNGTNAGRKSLAEDKGPDVPAAVPADASSSKDKAPEPSLVLLDKNQPTVSDLQKKDARYQEKKDAALALCRAKSDRTRKLAASQQSPYTANITARVIISNKKLYPGYNPFAPIDKNKLKELADWLKTCPHYRTTLDKKPRKSRTWWCQILRTSLEWLEDCVSLLL